MIKVNKRDANLSGGETFTIIPKDGTSEVLSLIQHEHNPQSLSSWQSHICTHIQDVGSEVCNPPISAVNAVCLAATHEWASKWASHRPSEQSTTRLGK